MKYPIDFYRLMPEVYRREDAGLGYPLEALLDIISVEAGHIQRNITDLWDDFFIETADEWVIPYIADLVGSTPLHKVAGSWRADVARTIYYRRRKGTLQMLEEMAADVTGWGAKVVAFFELLEWTQYLDHLRIAPAAEFGRSDRVGTVNVGNVDALDRLDGPFDIIAHSADIRPFGAGRGRHNIRKIGFFLWRLKSNPLYDVTPRAAVGTHGFYFSPLGNVAPMFTNYELPPDNQRPEEADMPGPVRRLALYNDMQSAADSAGAAATAAAAQGASLEEQAAAADRAGAVSRYYGPDSHHSMAVAVGEPTGDFATSTIPAHEVIVCDLSDWRRPTPDKKVAIDPVLGRFTLAEDAEPGDGQTIRVSYSYGFSGGYGADLGGGLYDRRAHLTTPGTDDFYAAVAAARPDALQPGTLFRTTIRDALSEWIGHTDSPRRAIVEVRDSRTYNEAAFSVDLAAGRTLELQAANRQRPVMDVSEFSFSGSGDGRLIIDGIAIMGAPLRIGPGMTEVILRNCTLVPGRSFKPDGTIEFPDKASLMTAPEAGGCAVTIANCIVGPVRMPAEGSSLTITDSIIDAPEGQMAIGGPDVDTVFGPTCDLRRVTVMGGVRVRCLGYASDVIFTSNVWVERTQTGCVRYSYVSDTAETPRRYRCQPDLALENVSKLDEKTRVRARLMPRFTSRRYGQPGYGQLGGDVAIELTAGAENEAEMGAFNGLMQAQRLANLRIRLDEYLPAGLEAGLIYET